MTLYAPVSENDFREAKRGKQKTPQIPKKDFAWLREEQTYRCPEGHVLVAGITSRSERTNGRTVLQTSYRYAAEHCTKWPRGEACTPSPRKGRSVSRLEHEDLVDELRVRVLDDLTTLTTVTLRISEIKDYVPEQAPTYATRVRRVWSGSIDNLVVTSEAISIALIAALPWLGVLLVPVLLLVLLLRMHRRRRG